MKWPRKIGDQLKLMDDLDYLYKMKLESGCSEEEAKKWIKEMIDIYRQDDTRKILPDLS